MIFVKNTPNNTGVAVYGDYRDFSGLYEALHDIVGNEEEFSDHEMSRLRVLGVCYDLRHAMMGDREYEFVDNGMDDNTKRKLSVLTPDKNIYLKINVLWPELLFVMMALNDFILLYAKKKARQLWAVFGQAQYMECFHCPGAYVSSDGGQVYPENSIPGFFYPHDESDEPGLCMDGKLYHPVFGFFERPVFGV